MPETIKKTIFCAACQKDTEQDVVLALNRDGHAEAVCSCPCGRALKFAVTDQATFERQLGDHKAHNTGQVSAEAHAAAQAVQVNAFKAMMGE